MEPGELVPGSIGKAFDNLCPYMMAIGMSYDEFWEGEPDLARVYVEADKARTERASQMMWLQGMYVYQAIGAFAEILPAFPRKGAKIRPYIEEPLSLTKAEAERRKRLQQERKEREFKAKMQAWANQFNQRKGGEKDERNSN